MFLSTPKLLTKELRVSDGLVSNVVTLCPRTGSKCLLLWNRVFEEGETTKFNNLIGLNSGLDFPIETPSSPILFIATKNIT